MRKTEWSFRIFALKAVANALDPIDRGALLERLARPQAAIPGGSGGSGKLGADKLPLKGIRIACAILFAGLGVSTLIFA